MNGYSKPIKFHCAAIFNYPELWINFLELIENEPFILKNNVEIASLFDCPSKTLWNGGRIRVAGTSWEEKDLISIKDYLNNKNIPIRFTFTNMLLTEEHLKDKYCNLLLKIFSNGKNEIIIHDEKLKKYIENLYPNKFKYISSTTKCLSKEETLLELKKDYYLIVLNYYYNKDFNFLKELPDKNKIEILVNSKCGLNCGKRKFHYQAFSKCQIENRDKTTFYCPVNYNSIEGWAYYILPEEIESIYIPLGFSNFKIEGRGDHPLMLLAELCKYLIKDEYQGYVYDTIERLLNEK